MADNKVIFEVIATAKGVKVVQKDTEKLAQSVDKTGKAFDKADKKQGDFYNRQEKGVIGVANGTKSFSKMQQTIGSGSSGLVGAYATLAANVFAATAAFTALRQAAAFEQLSEGFTFMANEAGRTTSLVVDRLKDITGQALSTREALEGASLALSAGFETQQLEELAKVARGASLALGRNLNDAFDRLTRGAIKLEPEILDELGIMVRLDDAVEKYAAQLGKSVKSLTQFERQQAFLNAINEQGIEKYGAIADAIDVNPFDRLAAAFEDLTKRGLTVINKVIVPIAELFAGSGAVLTGGIILFGSTILTQMIPALGQMSQRSAESAAGLKEVAMAAREGADESVVAAREQILAIEKPSKSIRKVQGILKKGNIEDINLTKEVTLAKKRLATAQNTAENGKTETARTNAKIRIKLIEEEIAALQRLQTAGAGQVGAIATLGDAERDFNVADRESQGLQAISASGPLKGFKEANKQFKDFRKNADLSGTSVKLLGFKVKGLGPAFKLAGVGAKFFGTALLNAIPFIGQLIFFGGIAIDIFKKLKESIFPTNKALQDLGEILDTLPDKFDQLTERQNDGASAADISIRNYKITSGILQELSSSYNALAANAANAADKQMKELEARGALQQYNDEQKEDIRATLERRASRGDTRKAQQSLRDLFAEENENSQLLKDEIIKASRGFRVGAQITAEGETKLSADRIAAIIKQAKESVGLISTSFTSLEKQVTDSERVYAKFFEKFEVKTEFDDLVSTFESMGETIASLGEKGKEAEVKKILEDLGSGAKKFGISAENAETQVPKLAKAFEVLREGSVTLKNELAVLDTQIKTLKKFEKFSGDAAAATIDLQNTRIDKQLTFNQLQREQLQNLADNVKKESEREGLLLRIAQLDKDDAKLVAERTTELEKAAQVSLTTLEIKQKENDVLAKNLAFEQEQARLRDRVQALGAGREQTPAEKFRAEISILEEQNKADKVRLGIEKQITQARFNVIAAELHSALTRGEISQDVYNSAIQAQARLTNLSMAGIDKQLNAIDEGLNIQAAAGAGLISGDLDTAFSAFDKLDAPTIAQKFTVMTEAINPFIESLKALGASGEYVASLTTAMMTVADTFIGFNDRTEQLTKSFKDDPAFKETGFFGKMGISPEKAASTIATLEGVSSVLSGFGQAIQAEANMRTAAIDQAIEKEKRLDGKSAESLQKIKAMEKKKESIQRKAFEDNKKMQIATTIINTASAIVRTLAELGPIAGPILATAIGALGMAQIAIIRKQQFQGGSGDAGDAKSTSLTIGGRSNAVDVSRTASAGELNYLRGGRTTGNDLGGAGASFPGGAMGRRGYANGGEGIMVGERGPEVITPAAPVDITPNYALGGTPTNVNFSITTLDASGVEDVLTNQRGNIIRMIREAANENGELFLENVDPLVYGGGD